VTPRGAHSVQVKRVGALEVLVIDLPEPDCALAGLTASEQDILARLLRGDSNREIAGARGTSARTVANQLQGIYRKHGVYSRTELIAQLGGLPARAK
jgi:DNA-binding NarL/FixJ family response regulator